MNELFDLRNKIKCRLEEIERLRDLADSLPSADPSKEFITGGNDGHCRFADVVNEIVTLEGEIADEIEVYTRLERKVRKYIASIENPRHRDFLWYKCVCFLTMEQIAEKMDLSVRQIYNISAQTSLYFKAFSDIIYTEEEAQ